MDRDDFRRPRRLPRPGPDPDGPLVERCRGGDRAALGELYRRHVRGVERVLGRLLGATQDLEDLVQSTFLEALRALHQWRGEATFRTWLARVAVGVAQHYLRATIRRRARLVLVRDGDRQPDIDDPSSAPEHAERRLDSRRLYAALEQLRAPRRIALLLHLADGYTVDEVAVLMGASRFATRARLALGRRQLRAALGADMELRALLGGEDADQVGAGARRGADDPGDES